MADLTVKDINDQPVGVPSYYFGVNSFGKAIRAIPVVPPVSSVIGLTGSISQSQLRTALGMGNAAYVGLGTTGSDAAYGNHTHTPASIGAEAAYGAGTTSQYLRGDKSWQTLNKAAVGLSNADNTSDASKPISTATQTALNAKEPTIVSGSTTQWFRGDKQWALLSKSDVGLSNVDNTTDAGKPVSTATQTALDAKNKNITWKKDTTTYGSAGSIGSVKFTGAGVTLSEATGELTVSVPAGAGAFDGNLDANLNITGASRRITGDFTNTTLAQRTYFQTSLANSAASVGVIPSGTSIVSSLIAHGGSDPDNSQFLQLHCLGGTSTSLRSRYQGTPASGTFLPMQFYTGDVLRQTILASGEIGIGVTPVAGKGALQVPDINGAAASGFKNKIINGCMRISKKGNGAAVPGLNYLGADGIITGIGGWSAISGAQLFQEGAITDGRTSSGGIHYLSLGTPTGASGYIVYSARIEAADTLELAGKTVTISARLTPWATAIDKHYIRVFKANALNNFGALTQVATSSNLGPVAINATATPFLTTTLAAADCSNGIEVQVVSEYSGTIAAASHNFLADFQCCLGSQVMPFEPRPIAIEEQLRRRYYRKQAVWVGTSTAKTVMPIDMFGVPTITGGGTGFTSTGTTADTLMCYQTTAAAQTLTITAEL